MEGDEFLQHIVGQLKDMLCIVELDGTLRQVNPTGCGMLRYAPNEITGKSWAEMFEENSKPLAPEIINQTIDGAKWSGEILFRRSNGDIFPVYLTTSLIPDPGGRRHCIAAVATDITHKKRLEEIVRKRTELINKIINNAPMGVLALDRDGVIQIANMAFCNMIGIPQVTSLSHKKLDELGGEFNPTLQDRITRALKGEVVKETAYLLLADETRRMTVSLTLLPLHGLRGKIDGVVALMEDRTDRAKMEEKLLQADRLASMGYLAAGVAHEISNPLAGMYTIIEGFRDDARSKGEEDEPYERILSSIDRIKGIIGNMLTFANPSSNAPRMTQLNDLIIQSVEFFKYQPVYRRIRIIMDLADDLPETVLDPNLLIQVIHNMFINSAQAMPDKGEVHINTNYNSNWIIFEFADTGIGISPENLPKIFDPFFTTKPPGMGTGLGLSVSYGIIHDHGGSIEVESEEGKGTKFTIKLPVKKGAGLFDEG